MGNGIGKSKRRSGGKEGRRDRWLGFYRRSESDLENFGLFLAILMPFEREEDAGERERERVSDRDGRRRARQQCRSEVGEVPLGTNLGCR